MNSPGALLDRLWYSSDVLPRTLYRIGTVGESNGDSWTADIGLMSGVWMLGRRFTGTDLTCTFCRAAVALALSSSEIDRFFA